MGALLKVFKKGKKIINLTNHSIKDVYFDFEKERDFTPRLNSITHDIIFEGLINTDLINEVPQPLLSDDDPILNEEGEVQYELLEIDSVRELVQWAIIPEYGDPYCDVIITLLDSSGEIVQENEYKDMFVINYEESFDEKHGNGMFKMHIRERYVEKK